MSAIAALPCNHPSLRGQLRRKNVSWPIWKKDFANCCIQKVPRRRLSERFEMKTLGNCEHSRSLDGKNVKLTISGNPSLSTTTSLTMNRSPTHIVIDKEREREKSVLVSGESVDEDQFFDWFSFCVETRKNACLGILLLSLSLFPSGGQQWPSLIVPFSNRCRWKPFH